jgi:hypothetical protein
VHLRLKCYNTATVDALCEKGISLIGSPCDNPHFDTSLFSRLNITQLRFCVRFFSHHSDWVNTINIFDSGRSDEILRVKSGNFCASVAPSDTTYQDSIVSDIKDAITAKKIVSEPQLTAAETPIHTKIQEQVTIVQEILTEITEINKNDKQEPGVPGVPGVPGIFSKIGSKISGLRSALASGLRSWLPTLGGASSRNLLTKTKRKSVRSRSHVSRLSQRGGRGRGRGGRGGGRGSKIRRRPLRRTNKKLK